jgi:hypothetical protein
MQATRLPHIAMRSSWRQMLSTSDPKASTVSPARQASSMSKLEGLDVHARGLQSTRRVVIDGVLRRICSTAKEE